jgi:hypothetical protein
MAVQILLALAMGYLAWHLLRDADRPPPEGGGGRPGPARRHRRPGVWPRIGPGRQAADAPGRAGGLGRPRWKR